MSDRPLNSPVDYIQSAPTTRTSLRLKLVRATAITVAASAILLLPPAVAGARQEVVDLVRMADEDILHVTVPESDTSIEGTTSQASAEKKKSDRLRELAGWLARGAAFSTGKNVSDYFFKDRISVAATRLAQTMHELVQVRLNVPTDIKNAVAIGDDYKTWDIKRTQLEKLLAAAYALSSSYGVDIGTQTVHGKATLSGCPCANGGYPTDIVYSGGHVTVTIHAAGGPNSFSGPIKDGKAAGDMIGIYKLGKGPDGNETFGNATRPGVLTFKEDTANYGDYLARHL